MWDVKLCMSEHDFVANPCLSIASTRDLLDLKRTLEEREMALAAAPPPLVSGLKVKVAMEALQPHPSPPPPIPQKPQHQQPQHIVAAEQPIWPVSVSRERPQSLLLMQNRLPDRNGRPEGVDQSHLRVDRDLLL
ncbi:unnamed protein product [Hydatigera taeniaeformis]|uniref:Uncharacterized protein n=1 Tax=Hydatigena taeniaeformis TaxID=6205 RepID=A0A0R3WT73_HYDTA|nr:unnamed protein product [Hydatigera taeniaeformis]